MSFPSAWCPSGERKSSRPRRVSRTDEPALRRDRSNPGRSGEAPVISLPLNREPTLDECKRLEDLGVTSVINMPLTFSGESVSTLERKREVMEAYAERLIVPLGR